MSHTHLHCLKTSFFALMANTVNTRIFSLLFNNTCTCFSSVILSYTVSLQFRDFLRRVSSSKLRETNPKCKITSVITCDYSAPTVDVTFSALHREGEIVLTVCISEFHIKPWEPWETLPTPPPPTHTHKSII